MVVPAVAPVERILYCVIYDGVILFPGNAEVHSSPRCDDPVSWDMNGTSWFGGCCGGGDRDTCLVPRRDRLVAGLVRQKRGCALFASDSCGFTAGASSTVRLEHAAEGVMARKA